MLAVLASAGCAAIRPEEAVDPPGTAQTSIAAVTVPGRPESFVRTAGTSFRIDGADFRFVGVNIYDAAATGRYSCNQGARMSDDELESTLRFLRDTAGANVVRFWAYQTYTQAGTDWTGVDRVIRIARGLGMRVLPVLEDGPGNCTTSSDREPKAEYRGDTWYSAGYREPYGNASMSYRDYVRVITAHYAGEPTIMGWSMINEADTSARDDQGRSVLVPFAQDIAGVIRQVDSNHLITLGTQSNGAPGASGPDFRDVYSLPDLDFSEVHDWGYWGADDEPMPGADSGRPPDPASAECAVPNAPIACSFAIAPQLGKPLLVGEAGIHGRDATERAARAEQLGAKMSAAFAAGAGGYLVWHVNTTMTDGYDVLLDQPDPLFGVLHQMAVDVSG